MTKGVPWPDALKHELAELWADPALSAAEIANRLGVSLYSVQNMARKLGMPKPARVYPSVESVRVHGGVAHLALFGAGGPHTTRIDVSDLDAVLAYPGGWVAHREKSGSVYVYSRRSVPHLRLHRFVLNAPSDKFVDHINGDTLDNRRANLRCATHQQNMWNSRAKGPSGYVGVYFAKHANLWTSKVQLPSGKRVSAGYYRTAEEAAVARDVLALKHHGEFARLNFPTRRQEIADAA